MARRMIRREQVEGISYTPAEAVAIALESIETRRTEHGAGVRTGIPTIDAELQPARPGEFIGVIGRTSHYKSGFMQWWARTEAVRLMRQEEDDTCVVYVTWEQAIEEMVCFDLAHTARIPAADVAQGRITDEQMQELRLVHGPHRMAVPLYLVGHSIREQKTRPHLTLSAVGQSLLRFREDFGVRPRAIFLDYLQQMEPEEGQDRQTQVFHNVGRCKDMALAMGCPVIVGSQAKREAYDNKRWGVPGITDSQWSCVPGSAVIVESTTGIAMTAREVFERCASAGFAVHSFDEATKRVVAGRITLAKQNGVETIYRMDCGPDGQLRANARHQVLTPCGWKVIGEIQPGDSVAMPSALVIRGASGISADRAYITGLLLGDGCLVESLVLTNADEGLLGRFGAAVEREWHGELAISIRKQTARSTYDATIVRSDGARFPGCNPAVTWAKEVGLFGLTAYDKHIPAIAMDDSAAAAMLAGLFETDGSVNVGKQGAAHITLSSASSRLIQDARRLLLRFGVHASIRAQSKPTGRPLWTLWVRNTDVARFAAAVPLAGPKAAHLRAALARPRKHMSHRLPSTFNGMLIEALRQCHKRNTFNTVIGRGITAERLGRIASAIGAGDLAEWAAADVRWATVVSVEPDGNEATFDFHVPGYNNYVVDGFISHNSNFEHTCDKALGVWYPCKEQEPPPVKGPDGRQLPVTKNLLIVQLLKQRLGQSGRVWALYVDPERNEISAMAATDMTW